MGFFIFRCQRSAFYANERMRATSDATTPRKGEIQPNFSRFQAFLRVFHRVENEAHSMQINECTDTTTLPERLKKRKNTAKLFPDLKCISPREREREISKMIRTPWKKKLSNSIRRIIKWITNFLIKVGIKGGIKPDKCALACLVRWSALKYTTNRRGKDLENGPPSIRNLAQVVLLLSTYYSKLLFEGRSYPISVEKEKEYSRNNSERLSIGFALQLQARVPITFHRHSPNCGPRIRAYNLARKMPEMAAQDSRPMMATRRNKVDAISRGMSPLLAM